MNSYTQIVATLAKVQQIRDMLSAAGVRIPGAISDAIYLLNALAADFQGATAPTDLPDRLVQIENVLKAIEGQTGHTAGDAVLLDLIGALAFTTTGIKNLETGQFATVLTTHISLTGKEVPVAALLCRMDEGPAAVAAGFQEPPKGTATVDATALDDANAQLDLAHTQIAALESQNAQLQTELAAAKAAIAAAAAAEAADAPKPNP